MLHPIVGFWRFLRITAVLICLAAVSAALQRTEAADATDETVQQWLAITDTVMAHHVDSPTRQEMLKAALQKVYRFAKQDPPPGLASKISQPGSDEELRAFLRASVEALMADDQIAATKVRDFGIQGILVKATGAGNLIPTGEVDVQEQLRDNRYVGIGIQLGLKEQYPTMIKVFFHGPAWNAGGRDGDQMVSIDGLDAKGMPLKRVVELLRGQEGKPTTIVVRRAGSEEDQALNMVRGVVPFDTVQGTARDDDQNWQYKIADDPRIAYLKLESIRGSTPAELRRIAGRLHADGCRALVLDLRRTQPGELRYAVMVADLLLGEGPIGQVLDARGRRHFDSTADQLFPGWPMAVLVDRATVGQAEWIGAALKDSRRATLLGVPTAGRAALLKLVELPGGIGGVWMNVGTLCRRDGKPITAHQSARMVGAVMRRPPTLPMLTWGVKPDRPVKPGEMLSEGVMLLQGQLKATTTTSHEEPAAPPANVPLRRST